jgi:spore maturation protein CgeB
MKILYCWDHHEKIKPLIHTRITNITNHDYDLTSLNHRKELGIERAWHPDELDKLYRNKDERLLIFYEKVRHMIQDYDVFLVNHENIYHPDFVKSLKNVYTVLASADDPESSDFCSKPYVHAFDHCFAWGVNFDKDTKITQKYIEWGAKRAHWWPHGAAEDMYNPDLSENDIYNKERDISVVFVGTHYLKTDRIIKVKKALGNKLSIYGRGWSWRICMKHLIWKINELSMDALVPLYQRTKIGINIHMSYGPSNVRTYQLPANGVMQICDCREGLGDVYKIGKEVICYDTVKEAIDLIQYYLVHENERKEIAAAGFKRTMRDYKRVTTFNRAIEQIKIGMLEDGINYFKDGTPVTIKQSKSNKIVSVL